MTPARIIAIASAVLLPAAALLWTSWPSEEGILLMRALKINAAAIVAGTLGLAVFRDGSALWRAMVINLFANAIGLTLAASTLVGTFGANPRLSEDVTTLFLGITVPASVLTLVLGYPVIFALKRLNGDQPTNK